MTIFDDLEAEQQRLDGILAHLDGQQWAAPSQAEGWTIADVVLHLAQSEEAVIVSATATGRPASEALGAYVADIANRPPGLNVDDFAAEAVRAERATTEPVLTRWRRARSAALAALRAANPRQPLRWVEAPLKPATLATTRLAEHWAHGLDITAALGVDLPDTERLRHVAWLAHRTLPYAFALAGQQPGDLSCVLTAPNGSDLWSFGPPGAPSVITGPAGAFCRVAAQRLAPEQSGLQTAGPDADAALHLVRTYAA
jgi:uncharacterized protein (TIGR03084 family)